MSCGGSERRTISRPEVASRYVPASRLENLYTPPGPRHSKNEGGPFLYRGGGVTLVKHWTSLYLFLQLRETNSVPALRVRDPAKTLGTGWVGS